jgi:ribosomal protein S20
MVKCVVYFGISILFVAIKSVKQQLFESVSHIVKHHVSRHTIQENNANNKSRKLCSYLKIATKVQIYM